MKDMDQDQNTEMKFTRKLLQQCVKRREKKKEVIRIINKFCNFYFVSCAEWRSANGCNN